MVVNPRLFTFFKITILGLLLHVEAINKDAGHSRMNLRQENIQGNQTKILLDGKINLKSSKTSEICTRIEALRGINV